MRIITKNTVLYICLFLFLTTSIANSKVREGVAVGVFYTAVTATNPWVNGNINTEGSTGKWNIPIHWGQFGDGIYLDFATDYAGWIVLMALAGDSNTPEFSDNNNFNFVDVNIASGRVAVDLFEMEIPILIGGQGSFGYMGIDAQKKAGYQYFEKDSYASYGINVGTNVELGDKFLQAIFLYDWVYMGEERKGKRLTVEVEYFPFSASSALNFVRLKVFTKSTEMSYPKNIAGSSFKYSDFQVGVGVIFNIIF